MKFVPIVFFLFACGNQSSNNIPKPIKHEDYIVYICNIIKRDSFAELEKEIHVFEDTANYDKIDIETFNFSKKILSKTKNTINVTDIKLSDVIGNSPKFNPIYYIDLPIEQNNKIDTFILVIAVYNFNPNDLKIYGLDCFQPKPPNFNLDPSIDSLLKKGSILRVKRSVSKDR